MDRLEGAHSLPFRKLSRVSVLGARSPVHESQSPSSARGTNGGTGAIGTQRGSRQGDRSPAKQLPDPDRRTPPQKFPLESSGRHRPLSRWAFESRGTLEYIDSH